MDVTVVEARGDRGGREAKRVFQNSTLERGHQYLMSMHTLSFSLTLEGVVRIHDAVLCLAKFSEVVSLEARTDKVQEIPFCLRRYTY